LKKKKNKRSPVAAVCSALGTLLLIVLIIFCIPLSVPQLFGYELYTVISGSMEPEIPVGSLVFIKATDPADAKPEDVVAFYGARDSAAIITHRVVENHVVTGELITKGDANQTNDMNPVEYANFIGTVVRSIPKLGAAAQMMTSFEGKVAAGGVIGLAVILHAIAVIVDRETEKKAAELERKRKAKKKKVKAKKADDNMSVKKEEL